MCCGTLPMFAAYMAAMIDTVTDAMIDGVLLQDSTIQMIAWACCPFACSVACFVLHDGAQRQAGHPVSL
jgi:hypothetical protein